jgi:hypothetical protein
MFDQLSSPMPVTGSCQRHFNFIDQIGAVKIHAHGAGYQTF